MTNYISPTAVIGKVKFGKNIYIGNNTVIGTQPQYIGFNKKINSLVLHQVKLAKKANLDGVVCSANEVKKIRRLFKKEIITPGIRFDKKKYDQKRVTTPEQAFSSGANYLVMGRSLINTSNLNKKINLLKRISL